MRCHRCGQENTDDARFCNACGTQLAVQNSSSDSGTSESVSVNSGFVGRQWEIGQLISVLDDTLNGDGRIVALVGEPGIGKTRTARELASIAESQGAKVVWGHCYEEQGAPPYWPWIQPLRGYIQSKDGEQLAAEMGAGASNIAEVIPELRQKLPNLGPSPQLEPEQARFQLFDSITTFLKNSSQDQPVVLILDDLHWSDRSSLLLLEFVAREIANNNLLIICTYRDVELNRQHPLSRTLAQLSREPVFSRLILRGLSRDYVSQFIEVVSGARPSEQISSSIFVQTEGNPFFMEEVTRLLQQETGLEAKGEVDLRIPEGVREVIGERLNRLSDSCNELLRMGSVIGREFSLEQLDSLVDELNQNDILDNLEDALSAGLIEEVPTRVGFFKFTHALIQEALSDELSLTRRVRLHAQLAQALENLYGENAFSNATELAYHFAQAEAMLGSEKFIHYSIIAGEQAMTSNAFDEALTHFQNALSTKEDSFTSTDQDKSLDPEKAAILFGLGRAQIASLPRDQRNEAQSTLKRAFDAFVELGDKNKAVAVATQFHGFVSYSYGTVQMAVRALELVQPDSIEAGYLHSRIGAALSWETRDFKSAQEHLNKALEIARSKGERVLEVRTLAHTAQVENLQGHHREAIEQCLKVIEAAESLNELSAVALMRFICSVAYLNLGNGRNARIHAKAALEVAERLGNIASLSRVLWDNGNLAVLEGEWTTALELNDRALAQSPRYARAIGQAILINLHMGNFQQCDEYIKHLLEIVPETLDKEGIEYSIAVVTIPLVARITGSSSLLDYIESKANEILTSNSVPIFVTNWANVSLALIAIERNDPASSRIQYQRLQPIRGTQFYGVLSIDRLLGLLSQTMAESDCAKNHFEDALAFCRKAGYITELAWSLFDYSNMLLERNEQGDGDKAIAMLDESLAISTELGMKPLMERVIALKDKAVAVASKSPVYPDGLTQREVEVLGLIALGRTNQEIADELFISLRTVANHVTNILSKTNSSNRVEAAQYATRNGLS